MSTETKAEDLQVKQIHFADKIVVGYSPQFPVSRYVRTDSGEGGKSETETGDVGSHSAQKISTSAHDAKDDSADNNKSEEGIAHSDNQDGRETPETVRNDTEVPATAHKDLESGSIYVQFALNSKGNPIKLGDGTYGAVFLGRAFATKDEVAIKVYYDNYAMRPLHFRDINNDSVKRIVDEFAGQHNLDADEIRSSISNHRGTDLSLVRVLQNKYCTNNSLSPLDLLTFLEVLTKSASSSAVFRFRSERVVSGILKDSSVIRGDGRNIRGLVEILGGSESFDDILKDPGFKSINDYFDSESIEVTNHVLVMDCYSYSLKDLLERHLVLDIDESEIQVNGYELLKTLPHDLRVREALMLTNNVAYGLFQLHNVMTPHQSSVPGSYFHLDIKPGNIYIKKKGRSEFEVALGDIGNLPLLPESLPTASLDGTIPNQTPDPSNPQASEFAPGTQHYRSPEQKYFMDVANVRVININIADPQNSPAFIKKFIDKFLYAEEIENSNHGETVVLLVQDPKFENTLFESDDVVIFSKDTKRTPKVIKEFHVITGDDRSIYFAFVLQETAKDTQLLPIEKTQVEFYKKQRFRTDIFGIGAVLFDIITAGSSPEKFYESLRKYDRSEGESVEELANRYDTLTRGEIEGENPDFAEIFRPFRNSFFSSKLYPDKDIIRFILKCMLYQTKDTFYNSAKINEKHEASKFLCEELEELVAKYQFVSLVDRINMSESLLISRFSPKIVRSEISVRFDHEINKLQGLDDWPEIGTALDKSNELYPVLFAANRLLYGAYYFWQIVGLVRTKVPYADTLDAGTESAEEEHSLHTLRQVLPAYISLNLPSKERVTRASLDLEPTLAVELVDELPDHRLEQLLRSTTNPFIPSSIAGMRRDIRLLKSQKHEQNNNVVVCNYRFRDSSVISRDLLENGYIVVEQDLWKVAWIDQVNNSVGMAYVSKDGEQDENLSEHLFQNALEYVDGIYFSVPKPRRYYLEMLGLYLQHLIFTYSPTSMANRNHVNIQALLDDYDLKEDNLRIAPAGQSDKGMLYSILVDYARMFLKLTLHDSKNSYYSEFVTSADDESAQINSNDPTMLTQVEFDAEELYERIARNVLNTRRALADYPQPIVRIEGIPKEFKDELMDIFADLKDKPLDIKSLVKEEDLVVEVEGAE